MTFEETGTLPIGVLFDGKLCTEFTIRPLKISETMAWQKTEDCEACGDDQARQGLALYGLKIEIDGVPKKLQNLAFMSDMWDEDIDEIMRAEGRLRKKIAAFRGKTGKADHPGAAAPELSAGKGGGAGKGSGKGPGVAGSMGGDKGSEVGQVRAENPDQEEGRQAGRKTWV